MRLDTRRAQVLLGALALAANPTRGLGQATAEQLAKCAAIYSNLLRVECYDALAKRKVDSTAKPSTAPLTRQLVSPAPTMTAIVDSSPKTQAMKPDSAVMSALGADDGDRILGGWVMSVTTDPITDRKDVTFMLPAEGANGIDTPALVIRCLRGNLEAVVAPDAYLSDDNDEVTIRFGSEPPIKERWSEASNHSALFVPGGRAKVQTFIRKLAGYTRFVIQVQPYQKLPKALVFNLDGIQQVNSELWPMCPAR